VVIASGVAVREIASADEVDLSGFCCAGIREPWALEVEEAIRKDVHQFVGQPGFHLLVADDLFATVGVLAMRRSSLMPAFASIPVLAVSVNHRRRGIARALKTHALAVARLMGVTAVTSEVDVDNDAMLRLNTDLGADIRPKPSADAWAPFQRFQCTIRLG